MRCPNCWHDEPEGARFCGACGTPLGAGAAAGPAVCPDCGQPVDAKSGFCALCGAVWGAVPGQRGEPALGPVWPEPTNLPLPRQPETVPQPPAPTPWPTPAPPLPPTPRTAVPPGPVSPHGPQPRSRRGIGLGIALAVGLLYLTVGGYVAYKQFHKTPAPSEFAGNRPGLEGPVASSPVEARPAAPAPRPPSEVEVAIQRQPALPRSEAAFPLPGRSPAVPIPRTTGAVAPSTAPTTSRGKEPPLRLPDLRPQTGLAPARSPAPHPPGAAAPQAYSPPSAPAASASTPEAASPVSQKIPAPSPAREPSPPETQALPSSRPASPPARPGILRPEREYAAQQPPPAQSGTAAIPSSGVLIWSGKLRKGEVVTIDGGQPSAGTLQGALPGVPVMLETDFQGIGFTETPGPSNGWRRLSFRALRDQHVVVTLRWKTLQ